jgi:hypothetical protein
VGLLFPGLAATPSSHRAEALAGAEESGSVCVDGKRTSGIMRPEIGAIHRIACAWRPVLRAIEVNYPCQIWLLAIACFYLTNCAAVSHYQFAEPSAGWQTKTGQLMYRTAKTTLIGDAVVRFSNTGDFELTVSKGPGITLLSLRQDAEFAEFNATFAHQRWSGLVAQAPPQLRGWLGLRDQVLRAPNQRTLRYLSGNEIFLFRF